MLGTEKNFSLRYPLDIDRKTIDTGLIIQFPCQSAQRDVSAPFAYER